MSRNYFPPAEEGVFTQQMRKRLNHNTLDISTSTSALAKTSNVIQSVIPGLVTDKLEAGLTYHFELRMAVTQTTNGGLTLEFNTPDTLTLTSIAYETEERTASVVAIAQGTTKTMGTKIIDNATAAYISVRVSGSFVVNVAGTLQFTASQHTSHTDTTTIALGATLRVWCQANDTTV